MIRVFFDVDSGRRAQLALTRRAQQKPTGVGCGASQREDGTPVTEERTIAVLLAVSLCTAACGNSGGPLPTDWAQYHRDAANTGQLLAGTRPSTDTNVTSISIGGKVFQSSPVLAPGGD